MVTLKAKRRNKIKRGIRKKLNGRAEKPRISVYKSNKSIYVQVIDDLNGHTLVSCSSNEFAKGKNANVDVSKEVGKKLAEKAIANGIADVVFDRSGYLYHGKIKALAEGAREGGLKF